MMWISKVWKDVLYLKLIMAVYWLDIIKISRSHHLESVAICCLSLKKWKTNWLTQRCYTSAFLTITREWGDWVGVTKPNVNVKAARCFKRQVRTCLYQIMLDIRVTWQHTVDSTGMIIYAIYCRTVLITEPCESQGHGWRLLWGVLYSLCNSLWAPWGASGCLCLRGRLFFNGRMGKGSKKCKWMGFHLPGPYKNFAV